MNLKSTFAAALAAAACACLHAAPAAGQTYYPNDFTLDHTISGSVVVGRDSQAHNSSPTFTLVYPAYLFNGALDAYNSSTVNMSGYLVPTGVTMHDSSTFNMTGGVIEQGLNGADNSVINIHGGNIVNSLGLGGASTATISGGTFADYTFDSSSQPLNITGGTFQQSFNDFNNSVVNVWGGNYLNSGGLYGSDNSRFNFFGYNLTSTPAGDSQGYSYYTLGGQLGDGTSIDGVTVGTLDGSTSSFQLINITPEPGPPALLLAGLAATGAGLARRRRTRK